MALIGVRRALIKPKQATAGSLPTLAFIGATAATVAGQVATVTSASIGTASADRLVVVVFTDGGSAASASATVTIGGTSATVHAFANGANNNTAGIASLLVSSGTTATIVATYNAGASTDGVNFKVYTIKGLSSTTPVGTGINWDAAASPLSTTLATSSGGVVIVGANRYAVSTTLVFSGTETYTTDHTGSQNAFETEGSGSATGTATNASSAVTATWGGGTNHTAIAAASWR